MIGKRRLSDPGGTMHDIYIGRITTDECREVYEWLSTPQEADKPACSSVARLIRDVIEDAEELVSVELQDTKPLPPKMTAVYDNYAIHINVWSDGATSYTLCGKLTTGVTKVDNPKVITSPYTMSNITAGKIYTVAAYATGSGGESGLCPEISVLVPAVGSPIISAVGSLVTWEDVPSATRYDVYHSATPGVTTNSTNVASPVPPELVVAESGYYAARAVNPIGVSILSNEIYVEV